MPRVISCNGRTETVMDYKDVTNLIIDNLGIEVLEALKEFEKELIETPEDRMLEYVEDGVFMEQVKESGIADKLISNILIDLDDQGYLKKSKNIEKFIPNEEELLETIEITLTPRMMNYFK